MLADTALRLALRSMLNDLTYPETRKSRAATEAALQQDQWGIEHRNSLMRRALWWAKAQNPGVEAALRKALGEEKTGDHMQDDPGTGAPTRHGQRPPAQPPTSYRRERGYARWPRQSMVSTHRRMRLWLRCTTTQSSKNSIAKPST